MYLNPLYELMKSDVNIQIMKHRLTTWGAGT